MGAFAQLPAYRNILRDIITQKVTMFKGLNSYHSLPNVGPDTAIDLLNVVVNGSGNLTKLRYPKLLQPLPAGNPVGPARIFDFQTATQRYLLAHQLTKVWAYRMKVPYPADPSLFGAYDLQLTDITAGNSDFLFDFVSSNNMAFMANGTLMRKYAPNAFPGFITKWGIARPANAPVLGAPVGAGALTFTQGGRKYSYSYGNSITGHISTRSPVSAASGNLAAQNQPLTALAPNPADFQVDTLYWWGSLDGGDDQYLITSGPIAGLLNYTDLTPDAGLTKTIQAPTINDPPPPGYFLAKFQGRVFIFNLNGANQDIAYSGAERIFQGRPEESYPPFNRLRLATGADQVFGGGVIQAGVIAFDRSNRMFMFRGLVEDIVTNAPLLFAAYLEELPWKHGTRAHYTIDSTPYGLAWWSSTNMVMLYNGVDAPISLSDAIAPLLKNATPGQEINSRGRFINWLDREWYVLSFCYNGSLVKNRLVFIDINPDPDRNAGIFVSDIEADDIAVVEDSTGKRQLCITNGGQVRVIDISLDTINGMVVNPAAAELTGMFNEVVHLPAYWQSGYFGNEQPQTRKMFRWAELITDTAGLSLVSRIVDNRQYTFMQPLIRALQLVSGRATVNKKGKLISYTILFPSQDVSASVLMLTNNFRPTGEN